MTNNPDRLNLFPRPDLVEIAETTYAGNGVFAKQFVGTDSLIETSIAIPLPISESKKFNSSVVWEYYFVTTEHILDKNSAGHLLLGLASVCNHSSQPNAIVRWCQTGSLVWGSLWTLCEIQPGEELTIYYTNIDEYVRRSKIPYELAYGVPPAESPLPKLPAG